MRDRDSERNDAVIDTKLLVSVVLLEIAYLIARTQILQNNAFRNLSIIDKLR
jgi:hypothetical protein